mmetsp:Transcript_32226/g.42500  ORF Transcript_32226/g.42500 Transcript_32226/m.42500 type:complete len:509 (+) Transcript_32226:2-1528(+)
MCPTFFHLADGPLPVHRSQAIRAATLLHPLLMFHALTASGKLKANTSRKTPLDMTAYKYIFNACRIPQQGQDCYRISDPASSNHVVVLRNNKFYKVDTVDKSGCLITETTLAQKFQDIISNAGSIESPIGVLTSWNRDDWAKARQQLLEDGNEQALRIIEGAICAVCLDNYPVMSREQMAKNLWHGNGRNRFYDKSIQLIVAENGASGLLMEHSMADGFPASHYADYIMKVERSNAAKGSLPKRPVPDLNAALDKVQFNFTKETLKNIEAAEAAFDELIQKHDVRVLAFTGFGSDLIKSMKISPDAFCQIAIQLAFYKMTGTFAPTYEPAMMLPFLHGRTETIRSVSSSSKEFCEEFMKCDLQDLGALSKLNELLRTACNDHVQFTRDAASGKGIDRHLLGLRFLLEPGEEASIFEDPTYSKTCRWKISTSTLSNELFDGWGWGEVVPDGIGVAYTLKKKSLQFNVACRSDVDPALFKSQSICHFLQESLIQMRSITESEAAVMKSKL